MACVMDLDSMIFSNCPGASDPNLLALNYRQFLQKSFTVFFKKLEESLHLDLHFLEEKIVGLDPRIPFSPALFVYYNVMKEGYREKDLNQIFDALQALKQMPLQDMLVSRVRFSTIMTESWEHYAVGELRRTPVDEEGRVLSKSIQMFSLLGWEGIPPELAESLKWIEEVDENLIKEFHAYVACVKFYAGRVLESSTSSRFFGALYLRSAYPNENPELLYIKNLVHELSHLHLYAIMACDSLILNESCELFSSPLREDKRPMSGIFHAAFILARLINVFRKLEKKFPNETQVSKTISQNTEFFQEAYQTIEKYGRLTEKGSEILKSMEMCALG